MTLVALAEEWHSYLHNEHVLHGVADQEAERLVPLGTPRAIAHLWKEEEKKRFVAG